jgi:HlyD family secretion protein
MEGMTCVINFIIKQRENVLYISNGAVTMEDGKQYVEVKGSDGNITKKQITTGLSDGDVAEVVSGLKAGETVIVRSGKN